MKRSAWRSVWRWSLALAVSAGSASAQQVDAHRARLHYLQHCVGCHQMDGSGAPDKGIPSMRGLLADFTQVPGGREYIVQVPGVMNSPLKDHEIAELMNWLVPQMSEAGSPSAAAPAPYSAAEITRLRQTRPADVAHLRGQLMARMQRPKEPSNGDSP